MRRLLVTAVASMCCLGAAFAQSTNQPNTPDQQAAAVPYTPPTPAQQQEVQQNLKDVHFDFDRSELNQGDHQSLQETANWMKANPAVYVAIAGEADERGSIVYNLALSEQRAKATRDALVDMGVPADRIVYATGWGKLYPVCNQSDESCWSENRRAHFEPWQTGSLAASKSAMPVNQTDTASLAITAAK
jgi:outer membrane protein OmpA-like peptidoglycan-associated protein